MLVLPLLYFVVMIFVSDVVIVFPTIQNRLNSLFDTIARSCNSQGLLKVSQVVFKAVVGNSERYAFTPTYNKDATVLCQKIVSKALFHFFAKQFKVLLFYND